MIRKKNLKKKYIIQQILIKYFSEKSGNDNKELNKELNKLIEDLKKTNIKIKIQFFNFIYNITSFVPRFNLLFSSQHLKRYLCLHERQKL